MRVWDRLIRHSRLTWGNLRATPSRPGSPPFLILFINSICNQTCEHCFYWRNLNRKDDLTVEELRRLSEELGPIENLNLSGGEPFLRKEFAEICGYFIRNNRARQIYVPTNGSFPDRTVKALEQVLQEPGLQLFAVELSLDGMPEFHNRFRGMKDAFERSMETYDALALLQQRHPKLRIHSVSTATSVNMGEIRTLTQFLYERCPAMDHHNLALIRGDRKNPSLQGPALAEYRALYENVRAIWSPRERGRYGAIVEPMLQWAKARTAEAKRQIVPCRAGVLNAVVYSNGDVSLCETHAPIGNLREKSFQEIWHSEPARNLRGSIAAKQCWCTNEVFLWPSMVYHPYQLGRALAHSRPWSERGPMPLSGGPSPQDGARPALRILE